MRVHSGQLAPSLGVRGYNTTAIHETSKRRCGVTNRRPAGGWAARKGRVIVQNTIHLHRGGWRNQLA